MATSPRISLIRRMTFAQVSSRLTLRVISGIFYFPGFPAFRDARMTVVTDNPEDDDLMRHASVAYRIVGDTILLQVKDV